VTTLARSVNDASGLRSRIEAVRQRIDRAAARSGRASTDVRLVAVVKTVPIERIREALALGLTDLGESRVQEAESHIAALGRNAARWHKIGHLQRNKAARAAEWFDRIHSIDGFELARLLSRHAEAAGRVMRVLVEVNVSGEATKFGVTPDALGALVESLVALPALEIDGLMTVGPAVARAEEARSGFARLRALRDRTAGAIGRALPELSMGMSADFEVAVEEGSTMVRVGTALFGSRV
jgi:pyridoxal phosphate enzyme (YggS family)